MKDSGIFIHGRGMIKGPGLGQSIPGLVVVPPPAGTPKNRPRRIVSRPRESY